MPIILRSVKGSNLTPSEVDGNFTDLDVRVDVLETTPPSPVEISNITQTGGTFTVHMDDGSRFGPFPLPVAAFDFRGDWAATTQYFVNDVFAVAGDGVYLVETAFESGTAFDPDAAEIGRLLPDNQWYSGSGAPAPGLGDEGDFYLDTANGDVYRHQGTAGWAQIMNLTGPAGADGTTITTLDDVPDVDYSTAGPAEGDFLRLRGGAWVDEPPGNLDDAGDVDYGSPGPQEGDTLVYRSGAWVPEVRPYDFGTAFGDAPGNNEVIGRVPIMRAITIPANFAGSFGDVETSPAAQFDIDVQDDGVSIGTVSVSTGGVVTFATAGGTAKAVAEGSIVRFVAPDGGSSPETSIVGLTVGIKVSQD